MPLHRIVHFLSIRYRAECQAQTDGFHRPSFKKFETAADALEFMGPGFKADGTLPISPAPRLSPQKARVDHHAKPYDVPSTSAPSPKKKSAYGLRAEDVQDESGWDVVYTDGACQGNGGPKARGGIGVWWGPNDSRCEDYARHYDR